MAISYKIEDQFILIQTEGNFKPSDLNDTFTKIFSGSDVKPGVKILLHDMDSVYTPTSQDIESGVRNIEYFMKNICSKMAIVVSSDVNYGMGRMMETFCEQRDMSVRVFKDMDQAKQWLKI
jgi:hypothetical protein